MPSMKTTQDDVSSRICVLRNSVNLVLSFMLNSFFWMIMMNYKMFINQNTGSHYGKKATCSKNESD